jgi:hypothetical protein
MLKGLWVAAVLGAAVCVSAAPAMAAVSVSTSESENDSGGNAVTNSGGSVKTSAGILSSAHVTNGPVVSATAATGGQIRSANAAGDLIYNFTADIPGDYISTQGPVLLSIPMLITYAGSTSITPGSFGDAVAMLQVRDSFGTAFSVRRECGSDSPDCGAFGETKVPFDFRFYFSNGSGITQLGTVGEVELSANATQFGFDGSPLNATAWIDPIIEIDPQFLHDNPGFSLSFDSTTFGGGGVPEPATWALLVAGFGLAGAGLRRRRRAAVA